jgi:hypothetical protein
LRVHPSVGISAPGLAHLSGHPTIPGPCPSPSSR